MGRMKALLMGQQEDLEGIVDLDKCMMEAKTLDDFHMEIVVQGGVPFMQWMDEVGRSTAKYIIKDYWDEEHGLSYDPF